MARDYERDRWGRHYSDDVERYDRDDRRQRMRSDLDYGRERGYDDSHDRERYYSDNEVDYGRGYGARRSDLDYEYRSRGYDRERDYGRDYDRDTGMRGGRGREDERVRYRGDDREISRDRYASGYDRDRYRREDDRERSRRGGDDWAAQVPDHYRHRGPYEDYGWEAGESVLPQFRDPSVHDAPYERRHRARRDDRSWWERTRDEVASWFGGPNREDEHDEDVRRGYRGRGPRDYRRSDDRIREEINDRLTDDDFLDASQIEATVENGEVILAGYVYNRTSKRRAEQIAERVSGVTNVENRLRVIPYGSTAANNWDVRQPAGANQMTGATTTDARDETDTTDTSASVTAGNRSS